MCAMILGCHIQEVPPRPRRVVYFVHRNASMLLARVRITHFKSITDSEQVDIDPAVTVLVGQNESGKTGVLQALYKARPLDAQHAGAFRKVEEYPRRFLNKYDERHPDQAATVARLEYTLDDSDVAAIEGTFGANVLKGRTFAVERRYAGADIVSFNAVVDEPAYVVRWITESLLDQDTKAALQGTKSLRAVKDILAGLSLNAEGEQIRDSVVARVAASKWQDVLAHEIYTSLVEARIPRALYFDDYSLLPGKVNLPELADAVERDATTPGALSDEQRTTMALLRMAGVTLEELNEPSGYENTKAKLEGFSNDITDQMFEFWTQNKELSVEFDLRADSADRPPFNNGVNLYIRIKNQRHRVTVPFDQRSKGFIWFFSFLAWFKSVRASEVRVAAPNTPLVLLLDEPGLSLHALAQNDLLRFIDTLAADHQVIYSTHSPFMVRSDRLHQVRVVEDKIELGTTVSANVASSSAKTRFPLQAALGYTIAQNLFISSRNLLIEGPSDLLYLQQVSGALKAAGRVGLRDDITLVPTGGLDKVATFIALLGGNELELAVLHDSTGQPDQRLVGLAQARIVDAKQILTYGAFRQRAAPPVAPPAPTAQPKSAKAMPKGGAATVSAQSTVGDVEDLFAPAEYLAWFNSTFAKELNGLTATEAALPNGDRIVARLEQWIGGQGISLRSSGGFNHYRVAAHVVANPPATFSSSALENFEAAFRAVNAAFRQP